MSIIATLKNGEEVELALDTIEDVIACVREQGVEPVLLELEPGRYVPILGGDS